MLNQQDRRRLAAIERQILIDGPAFARRLGRGSVVVTSTWWKVAAAIIGILCGLATLIGTLSNSGTLTASSAALAATCGPSIVPGTPVAAGLEQRPLSTTATMPTSADTFP